VKPREKIGIQGDLVWTVSGPAESAPRGHDVSRGFHLRRPSESLGETSQVRPTVVSSPPVGRAQSCSPEILIAAHIAMPAPVAPFVTETRRPAPGARTPLAAPAGTCGSRFAAALEPETASSKEVSSQSRLGPPRCRFIRLNDHEPDDPITLIPGSILDCARRAARRNRHLAVNREVRSDNSLPGPRAAGAAGPACRAGSGRSPSPR
jgi:hypothetical protein